MMGGVNTGPITITEFLLARYDKEEAAAKKAFRGPWELRGRRQVVYRDGAGTTPIVDDQAAEVADLEHIALQDPVKVLADLKVNRWLVEQHELVPYYGTDRHGRWRPHTGEPKAWYCSECQVDDGMIRGEGPCDTLRQLASPYAGDSLYRAEEWKL